MSENAPQRPTGNTSATAEADRGSDAAMQFSMIQRGDFISAGRWHWRCRREEAPGNVAYGYVEADSLGNKVAAATFASDWG